MYHRGTRNGASQQHLRRALMPEVAIRERHAGDGSPEAAFILPFEIETRLEGHALYRGANGLASDLQRVPRQSHVSNGAGAAELNSPGSTQIVQYPACAPGAIEAAKSEHLPGHEPAGLIGSHHSRHCWRDHRQRSKGPPYETRKHPLTPTLPSAGNA